MLKGFKQFILRGNVVDLAVGVVIGTAFGAIVSSLVADILTPLIGAVAKVPDFSNLILEINGSKLQYGRFLNALISFILVASAIYFGVITPMNKLIQLSKKEEKPVDPTTKKCTECFSEINIQARRCPHCTSELVVETA